MKKRLTIMLLLVAGVAMSSDAQVIQPTPHSVKRGEGVLSVAAGANQLGVNDADREAVALLQGFIPSSKKGPKLRIGELGDKIFAKEKITLPQTSGAYYLKVDPKEGVTIIGADERGTYYGVRTLGQLISPDGALPTIEITDYPDILFRGSVEGFYGKPWSHRDRLAQLKFYGENKLNTYIYGPKDDPYHSSPNWRKPYPEQEAKQIRELAEVAKKYKVDFVWAIHPGQDIKWNEEDFQNLLSKFNMMYDLGVRSYAVFFDDISGEGTNPHRQAELLNRLNTEFVQAKGDVTPLIMCPTEYNKSWANPKPDGYLCILGEKLDPSVQIMWTGDRVCDDITMETLNWINERIKRPTYIWWNFPVTDYVRHKVLLGPSYGLDTKATNQDMAGFVSNPMENAEASKVALYGVADYTWNIAAYDYFATWERALKAIMPTASEAFRTFAIHSSDLEQNGHGYRRDESWETSPINPLDYTEAQYTALYDDFAALSAAPQKIIGSGGDEYLISELKPWLEQAELLGKRGIEAMEFVKTFNTGDDAAIWGAYLDGQMTPQQITSYNKHKPGTLVLQPFITKTRAVIGEKLYEKLSGEPLKRQRPICSFDRKETLPEMMDGNSQTYYYSWGVQKPGDWVGVDLGQVESVTNIVVEQGRKEKDRDYFQHAQLEYSLDSINWLPLTEVLDSAYRITYNSKPIEARYVRLRAADGCSSKNWTAIRRFDVNPMQSSAIVMTNLPQIASAKVTTEGNRVSIQPMLEVVRVEPTGYFGVELPLITSISKVELDLNLRGAAVEYSSDGVEWSAAAAQARYIRFINRSSKPVDVNLRRFDVVTTETAGADMMNLFDKSYATTYTADQIEIARPALTQRVTLLAAKGSKGELSYIDAKGNRTQLSRIDGAYCSVKLPDAAVAVVITGGVTLHEVIWGVGK